ncbi:MAG: DUF1800 domain-containing protein, partial [Bacteroidia bacterium]|nr:DUF1800 domain-containing protein [Bacteroidia bacterium]
MNSVDKQRKIQHLYWRGGFGPGIRGWSFAPSDNPKAHIEQIFRQSQDYKPLLITNQPAPSRVAFREMNPEERQALLRESRQMIKTLNLQWLGQMVQSEAQLREKMALFWHGHFACQSRAIFQAQSYLNTLRQHALGNFGEMVLAISKEPAMLQFLNNQQNHKQRPNENFARELMELFTLGRGHYSEQDIKESARAFTGWAFEGDRFVF